MRYTLETYREKGRASKHDGALLPNKQSGVLRWCDGLCGLRKEHWCAYYVEASLAEIKS